jgi:hypothetical protein
VFASPSTAADSQTHKFAAFPIHFSTSSTRYTQPQPLAKTNGITYKVDRGRYFSIYSRRTQPNHNRYTFTAMEERARGDVAAALESVEPVVMRLQKELPAGVFEPFRVYLTAVEILQAAGDGRQRAFLAVAQEKLNVLANRFTDDRLRCCYLEGVAIHRRLSALV